MTDARKPEKTLPAPGQVWESLDPRDREMGVTALVHASDGPGGFVSIQRFRKSRVRYENFVRLYRFVR